MKSNTKWKFGSGSGGHIQSTIFRFLFVILLASNLIVHVNCQSVDCVTNLPIPLYALILICVLGFMTLILLIVVVILSIVICVKSSKWKNSVSVKDFGDPAKAQMASQMDSNGKIDDYMMNISRTLENYVNTAKQNNMQQHGGGNMQPPQQQQPPHQQQQQQQQVNNNSNYPINYSNPSMQQSTHSASTKPMTVNAKFYDPHKYDDKRYTFVPTHGPANNSNNNNSNNTMATAVGVGGAGNDKTRDDINEYLNTLKSMNLPNTAAMFSNNVAKMGGMPQPQHLGGHGQQQIIGNVRSGEPYDFNKTKKWYS